ncbi:hypothetical protein K6Y76_16625 [Burkholderia cenocepacia]|uniref:hypothetical protein n=1 Tax=Burkholderia cenocepacia TaxID=95486 RepID=UPI00139231F3|nr:hypothetical protein [Burkholderia cenocepacia]MCG0577977.1 hypothetical protein [Burkholderia cenocepacia]MCW3524436.1 hypothetical protein [Burkholderia cenocepacia]MCW3614658.1 hypothetical protein [Burkholderia cenocepacia]MCW3652596.1 hypothetical protein [Burkholderia cenocepacia]MCW3667568.1 hypothetical protein [Burkholderia cenocepacia]
MKQIDFQSHLFPAHTEALVQRLKRTVIDGDSAFPFLTSFDPAFAARDLVDNRFVCKKRPRGQRTIGIRSIARVPAGGDHRCQMRLPPAVRPYATCAGPAAPATQHAFPPAGPAWLGSL